MKKPIVFILLSLFVTFRANAQLALEHTYPNAISWVVNLELSGKKIVVVNPALFNEIRLYDLNHSLWKSIHIPSSVANWGVMESLTQRETYISEKLFNNDNLLEAIIYSNGGSSPSGKRTIINENGVVVDSLNNISRLELHNTAPGIFKLFAFGDSLRVYALPGTIPCNECSGPLGISKVGKDKKNDLSDPTPNPSHREVHIAYKLPEGTKQGVIDLYNANGRKVKSFKVDNTFSYITLDNSELPSGVYYYNLIADGEISVTKKMVVIK